MELRNYLMQINTFLANYLPQTDILSLREPAIAVRIPHLREC